MRWATLVLASVVISGGIGRGGEPASGAVTDTLAERVVQRGEEAFNRHDADALAALYAPDAVLTFLTADSSRQLLPEGRDSVRAVMRRWWDRAKVPPRIRHLQRMSADGFVAEKDEMVTEQGTDTFLDIYEVRGGLIVHEWQEPQ
jgi:hypothetical protein